MRPRSAGNAATSRLAVELLIVWVALGAAGWIIGAAVTGVHPAFDAASVDGLRGSRTGDLTTAMRVITWFGSPIWLDTVFVIACATLCFRRAWRSLLFLALATPGTVLMVQLVKHAVNRTRPPGLHLIHAAGSSWPSGHASSSVALYGALFLIALRSGAIKSARARRGAALVLAVLLALIGISRIYLGVHYLTDVVAAWLLAAGWLNALDSVYGRRVNPRSALVGTKPEHEGAAGDSARSERQASHGGDRVHIMHSKR